MYIHVCLSGNIYIELPKALWCEVRWQEARLKAKKSLEVGGRLDLGVGLDADVLDGDGLARGAGDADGHLGGAEARGVLEEVVVLALGALPRLAAVGADLELGDGLVGVDDLHGEPVRRRARLVVQHQRRRDAALHLGPRRRHGVRRVRGQGLPGVLEEVEVALVTLGALVDDLLKHG